MAGLNSDPTTDSNYTSIDYAWYFSSDQGNLEIYESGTGVYLAATSSAWALTDVLSIQYDGRNVRYYKNGTLIRTTAAAAGLRLYADTSIRTTGGAVIISAFGSAGAAGADGTGGGALPASRISVIGSTQLAPITVKNGQTVSFTCHLVAAVNSGTSTVTCLLQYTVDGTHWNNLPGGPSSGSGVRVEGRGSLAAVRVAACSWSSPRWIGRVATWTSTG